MITYLLWIGAIAVEALILLRGVRSSLLKRYPGFYSYLVCVLLTEFLRYSSYRLFPGFYPAVYWDSELVLIVASYAIIFDIFKQALRSSTGVSRLAQKMLLMMFALAAGYIVTPFLHLRLGSLKHFASFEFSLYLRQIEAASLLVVLWLVGRYRVSLGHNLLGLLIGYSLLVGFDVMNVGFQVFSGAQDSPLLRRLRPIIFILALITWCGSLWSFEPDPAQPSESAVERDYRLLVARTQTMLARITAHLGRTMRP